MSKGFKKVPKVIFLITLILSLICVCGCSAGDILSSYLTGKDDVKDGIVVLMDTYVSFSLAAGSEGKAEEAYRQMTEMGEKLENNILSRHISGAEIYCVNEAAEDGNKTAVSEKLADYLKRCMEISGASGGAFDISLGALSDLWGIEDAIKNEGSDFTPPDDENIRSTLAKTGYEKIGIEGLSVSLPEGMILDMGAVGKGIFLDEAGKMTEDLKYGIIAAGGSIRTIGYKPGGDPWVIGIKDPFGQGSTICDIKLTGDYVISTSGCYERYVEKDGIRFHHIFDPATGYPAESGLSSVTVVMDAQYGNGLISDALSTAILVLGKEKGLELAEKYDAGVVLVTDDGDIIRSGI